VVNFGGKCFFQGFVCEFGGETVFWKEGRNIWKKIYNFEREEFRGSFYFIIQNPPN